MTGVNYRPIKQTLHVYVITSFYSMTQTFVISACCKLQASRRSFCVYMDAVLTFTLCLVPHPGS